MAAAVVVAAAELAYVAGAAADDVAAADEAAAELGAAPPEYAAIPAARESAAGLARLRPVSWSAIGSLPTIVFVNMVEAVCCVCSDVRTACVSPAPEKVGCFAMRAVIEALTAVPRAWIGPARDRAVSWSMAVRPSAVL